MTIEITSNFVTDETASKDAGQDSETKKEATEKSESNEVKAEKAGSPNESDDSENLHKDDESEGKEDDDDSDGDDDAESDEDSDEDLAAKEQPKKKTGWQKKKERFQRRLLEKDQEILEKDQVIEFLRGQLSKGKPEPEAKEIEAPKVTDKPKAPRMADFESHEEYENARDEYQEKLTKWTLKEAEIERKAKEQDEKLKADYENQKKTFQSKMIDLRESSDEVHETLSKVSDVTITPELLKALFASEVGPEVLCELSKNRDELLRVNRLSVAEAALVVGRIEARITDKKSSSNKVTKAPAPLKTVGASSKGSVKKSPEDMTQSEYEAWRREQIKQKRAAWG